MQAVAVNPSKHKQKALSSSGLDGVFVRPFIMNDEDRAAFRVVPFPDKTTLDAALRQAKFLGEIASGVVEMRKGYGVRVKAEKFASVAKQLHPDSHSHLVGDKWEISGLPKGACADAVVAFVTGWNAVPLYSFVRGQRRTWVVRAEECPPWQKLQHQDGLVVFTKASSYPSKLPRERWQPPKPSAFPPLPKPAPKSWAPASSAPRQSQAAAPQPPPSSVPDAPEQNPIASAIAAALAPLQAQIAELQRSMGGADVGKEDMETDATEGPAKRAGEGGGERPQLRLRVH